MLHINLLGIPEIYLDTPPNLRFRTRKAQALLIYLAVTEQQWSRDALATLFWPETTDQRARKNLRDILPTLRKQIGDYLWIDDDRIGINQADQYSCDVTNFNKMLEQPLQRVETQTLVDTLATYRGEFLEGYGGSKISDDFELWVLQERERLQQLALIGFTTLCHRQQGEGDYDDALTTNRQLLKLAPWDEATHRRQMMLLAQGGQQAAALAYFETCRQILADELDVAPDAETVALYEQIRSGDYAREAPASLPPSSLPSSGLSSSSTTVAQDNLEQAQAPQKDNQQGSQQHDQGVSEFDKALWTITHNLPASLLTLIGYVEELAYIQTQLLRDDCRLLTIVGLGGMGKTHLAIEAARQIVDTATQNTIEGSRNAMDFHSSFQDGIYFVPLDPLRAEASTEAAETIIAVAIARAINYTFSGDISPQVQLQTYLRNKKMLLVLDNMEHLLVGASLVAMVLQHAPRLRILATSRERLDLQGEQILALHGLNPQPDQSSSADDTVAPALDPGQAPANSSQSTSRSLEPHWHGNDAVALFAFRAQLTDRHFRVDDNNIEHILRICDLVDGLPLAIELAARLLDVFDCAMVAKEIAHSLDLLITSRRDIPQRHHTLRAVFDQSWVLLSPTQQAIIMRLSFFRPNFQAAAALSVAKASPHDLAGLVNKSLVGRTVDGHFTLHRAIRQFSREKLAQSEGNLDALEEQYISFYLGLLANYTRSINSAKWSQVEAEILNDIANVKAAFRLAIQRNMWTEVRSTVESIVNLYDTQGWFLEGADIAKFAADNLAGHLAKRQTLKPTPESSASQHLLEVLLGHLLVFQGLNETRLGRLLSADLVYQRSLSTLRKAIGHINASSLGSPPLTDEVAVDESSAGQIPADEIANYAQRTLESCLKLYGLLKYESGQPESALALLQESVPQDTSHNGVSVSFFCLARVMCELGDYQQAGQHAQTAIHLATKLGEERFVIFSKIELGRIEQSRGNYAVAQQLFQECYEARTNIGDQTGLTITLGYLGDVARLQCNYQASARYIQRGLALADQIEYATARAMLLWALGNLALAQEDYTTAKDHFVESQRVPGFNHFTVGLPTLGWANIGLAEFAEAEEYFHAVVEDAQQNNAKLDLLEGLGGLIVLLALAGEIEQPTQYLETIDQHPATTLETKERIRKMYVQMMNGAVRAKGSAYSSSPDLCQTIKGILGDMRLAMDQRDGQPT